MLLNIVLVFLSIRLSSATSLLQPKCVLNVNDRNMVATTFSLPLDKQYEVRFGSEFLDYDNEVLSYNIDMECFNNTNITASQHFYMTLYGVNVEINIHKCSMTKDTFLASLRIDDKTENFLFDTLFENLASSVRALEFKISMNNRYGNGCKETLFFVRQSKTSIFKHAQRLWNKSIAFKAITLFVLTLLVTAGIFTSVILIQRFYTFEKKTVSLNLPLVRFKKRPQTNLEFPKGVDNKALEVAENNAVSSSAPERQVAERRGEDMVRSIRFSVLREQFCQTEEKYIKKDADTALRAKALNQP